MRALDPRAHRPRAKSVRPLLTVDVALGIATALAVLLQATLLARIVARAFDGVPLDRLWRDLALLVLAFALRGACGWGMELAGRRAAWSVLSELRLALVERRLRSQPIATDGTSAAEIAAVAVQGDRGAGGLLRSLPASGRARLDRSVHRDRLGGGDRLGVRADHAADASARARVHVADRPLHRAAHARALAGAAAALDPLSRRGAGAAHAARVRASRGEAAPWPQISERYRATTMETLRVSFLSGSVLELAATLGVALVAVTAGVRLVDGALGLQAGLTVLILAPELYLPFRRLGAEYHASADGLAVAERMLALLDAPGSAPRGGPRRTVARARPGRPSGSSACRSPTRRARCPCSTAWTWSSRRARRWRWSARAAPARARSRPCCSGCSRRPAAASRSAGSTSPTATSRRGGASSPGCPQHPTLLRGTRRRQHPARRSGRVRRRVRDGRGALAGARCVHRAAARTATRRWSATGADPVAGRAPADRPRPRVPARRAARDPRRADGRSRRPQRVGRVGRRRAPASTDAPCC